MRLDPENLDFSEPRTPLPRLSPCVTRRASASFLPQSRVTRWVLCCAFAGALAVAHVYLSFAIRDLKVQQHVLQDKRTELTRQLSRLESQTVELSDIESIHEYARNTLHMSNPEASVKAVAAIPHELKSKYELRPESKPSSDMMMADSDNADFKHIWLTLLESGQAFAQTISRK